jgi:hypothetical protein
MSTLTQQAVANALEQKRRAQLDASNIKQGERQLDIQAQDVGVRGRLAESAEKREARMTEVQLQDPRRVAMQTLLDESAKPEARQQAIDVLSRYTKTDTDKKVLEIMANETLSNEEKMAAFERLGVPYKVIDVPWQIADEVVPTGGPAGAQSVDFGALFDQIKQGIISGLNTQ